MVGYEHEIVLPDSQWTWRAHAAAWPLRWSARLRRPPQQRSTMPRRSGPIRPVRAAARPLGAGVALPSTRAEPAQNGYKMGKNAFFFVCFRWPSPISNATPPTYQCQLGILIRIEAELVAGAAQIRCALSVLALDDRRRDQRLGQRGSARHADQVRAGAVFAVHRVDERGQEVVVAVVVAEADDVHVDLLLAQLLGHFDEIGLVGGDGRADKHDDAHFVVFALTMLQHQLEWGERRIWW